MRLHEKGQALLPHLPHTFSLDAWPRVPPPCLQLHCFTCLLLTHTYIYFVSLLLTHLSVPAPVRALCHLLCTLRSQRRLWTSTDTPASPHLSTCPSPLQTRGGSGLIADIIPPDLESICHSYCTPRTRPAPPSHTSVAPDFTLKYFFTFKWLT